MATTSQHLPLSSSLHSPWRQSKRKTTTPFFSLFSSIRAKVLLSPPLCVSLQDSQTQTQTASQSSPDQRDETQHPVYRKSIWVNPRSPLNASSRLARNSHPDSRLIRLGGLASSLDKSEPSDQAIASILSAHPVPITEPDAVIILDHMEKSVNTILSLRWFVKNIQLNKEVILYNVTFKTLRKLKDWTSVESLWDEMLRAGVKPDQVSFSTVISCARQCDLPGKAVEWFEKMPQFNCIPEKFTYSAIIAAYWQAGQPDKAIDLYDQARKEKWRFDPVAFTTMIRIHTSSGNFDGALNVFEEMKALGVQPNLVTYNVLLNAMYKASRPWQVKSIYMEMVENKMVPSRSTYAALIRAYSKGRYSKDAMSAYRQMKGAGMNPDVILYNMLLSMCADVGLVEAAEEMFYEMKGLPEGSRPDSWSYSSMITAYSCSGQVSEAEGMLNEMLDSGYQPNIFILTSLIQCYGNARRVDDVVRMFNKLLELNIEPDNRFCGCLLNVATQTPIQDINEVIDCIVKANPRLGSFVKLLLDEASTVESVREGAEQLFADISKVVEKPYFNCLMDICVNFGRMERAHVLLDLALQSNVYINLQDRRENQWILHVKGLSYGAALTALHVWMDDVAVVLRNGEKLPALLGVHTGHGKHRYGERNLFAVLKEKLAEMNAPFHDAPDKAGWLLTTDVAAKSWLETMNLSDLSLVA